MPAVPPRVYTCPTRLTGAGFDLSDLDADAVWEMILQASAQIDSATRQWFNGISGSWVFSGNGSRLLRHASQIPMQQVTQIDISSVATRYDENLYDPWWPDWATESIDLFAQSEATLTDADDDFHIKGDFKRAVERVHGVFPSGVRNITLQGILGFVEDFKTPSTTSTAEVQDDSVSVEVEDSAGFESRDVLEIVGEDTALRVIVTAVEDGEISFDAPTGALLEQTIPLGATVRSFGKVPRPIERLTHYFFALLRLEMAAYAAGDIPLDPSRMRRERTDDYEYELFPAMAQGISGGMTGNPTYDMIIRRYSAPGLWSFSR